MVVFELAFEALEPFTLPAYLGSGIRGALGQGLRGISCTTGASSCDDCPRRDVCTYGVGFEPSANLLGRRRATSPGYLVVAPFTGRPTPVDGGERFMVQLKLFGAVRAFATQFLWAAQQITHLQFGAARRQIRLASARRLDPPGGEPVTVAEAGQVLISADCPAWWVSPVAEAAVDKLLLRANTPLWLKGTDHGFDAEVLTARLSERLDFLAGCWDGGSNRTDANHLRALARQVHVESSTLKPFDFERRSRRARGSQRPGYFSVGGVFGEVTLRNVPGELIGLWRCAEAIHVGAKTTMGFGSVTLQAQ